METKISFNENPIKVASKQKENPCEKFVFAVQREMRREVEMLK